jgi:hypothetical protein
LVSIVKNKKVKKLKMSIRILALTVILFSIACAPSPQLLKQDRFSLQRNEILPEGVSSYHFISGTPLTGESSFFLFPLYWRQGVSKKVNLVWMPFPFEISYLLHHDNESQWTWIDFDFLGYVYARQDVFIWRPTLSLHWKQSLTSDLGIKIMALAQTEVNRDPFRLAPTLGPSFGLEWQALNVLLIRSALMVFYEQGETKARYLGTLPPSVVGPQAEQGRWRMPLQLSMIFQTSQRWQIRTELNIFRFGYDPGYTGLPLFVSFVYFW